MINNHYLTNVYWRGYYWFSSSWFFVRIIFSTNPTNPIFWVIGLKLTLDPTSLTTPRCWVNPNAAKSQPTLRTYGDMASCYNHLTLIELYCLRIINICILKWYFWIRNIKATNIKFPHMSCLQKLECEETHFQ